MTDVTGGEPASSRRPLPLVVALAGLVVAAVAGHLFSVYSARSGVSALSNGPAAELLAFVVIWVPLLAAVVVVSLILGRVGVLRLWHLRFHPLDLFWGVAAGLLARAADAAVNLGFNGVTGLTPQPLLGDPRRGLAVAVAILAPVVLAPLIEELFFRGLLQSSLSGVLGGAGRSAGGRGSGRGSDGASGRGSGGASAGIEGVATTVLAVVVTAALFAALHIAVGGGVAVGGGLASTAAVVLIGTFVFGLLAGALTAATGRIGGAVVAHIVFNGVAVWLTWAG